jgi:lipid II:glycine glycyltransferase (peptidoglycan interpeptide bridge formation enzyme)
MFESATEKSGLTIDVRNPRTILHDRRKCATEHTCIRVCRSDQEYEAWDRYVFDLPGAHYFQTYGWLKSYEPMGFTPHVLVYEVDSMICGGVAFLTAKVPLLPWRIAIIPHGPLPSDSSAPSWHALMRRLDEICLEQHVIYAQLYPHELTEKSALLLRLEESGFTRPAMFTAHRFSSTPVTVDLIGKTEEDMLMSFRPKTRQYVRRALSSECVVRTNVDPIVFDKIYALFVEHGELMGYHPRPYGSLRAAWEWFAPKEWATFIQVWRGETLVGAILLVFTGRTAYYLAGAVRRGFTEYRPAELMHWHAIREAIKRQVDTYDLVNVGTAGVAQFKQGFRPEYQSWHDPRTKVYRPVPASVLSAADHYLRPFLRGLARRRAN